jgi:hypothetical protein
MSIEERSRYKESEIFARDFGQEFSTKTAFFSVSGHFQPVKGRMPAASLPQQTVQEYRFFKQWK